MKKLYASITLVCFVFIVLHLLFPKVVIDNVTIGLTAVAIIPWVFDKIRVESINVSGTTIKFLEERIKENEKRVGEIDDANQKNELHIIKTTQSEHAARPTKTIDGLVSEYKTTRLTQNTGSERTYDMTQLVSEMIDVARSTEVTEIMQWFESPDFGRRIFAYVYAYEKPNPSYLDTLVRALTIEDIPFNQYWCLQALECIVLKCTIDKRQSQYLLKALVPRLVDFDSNTSRHWVLTQIIDTLKKNLSILSSEE